MNELAPDKAAPTDVVASGPELGLRLLAYTVMYVGHDIAADLRDIADKAGRNNPRVGITGLLLFDAGRFIQVLEGPHDSIGRLLKRIGRDPRAEGTHIIFDTTVNIRSMASWALRVGRLDHKPPLAIAELDHFREMYERGFRLDADGFTTLLLQLIEYSQECP